MDNSLQNIVKYLSPNNTFQSISNKLLFILILPMLLLLDIYNLKQIYITIMLILNILIRLLYPSSYYPASQSIKGVIPHPLTARTIAFFAEFGLYELLADWIKIDFWSNEFQIYKIVLFGEMISTIGVIFQSEIILVFEDIIWLYHSLYMFYLSYPNKKSIFFITFGLYLIFSYLPKRIKLLYSKKRNKKSIFFIRPLFKKRNIVQIKTQCLEEKTWVVPMLLSQAIITAFIYYELNNYSIIYLLKY